MRCGQLRRRHASLRRTLHRSSGFTLIELLASISILVVMSLLLFAAFDQTTKAWLQGESRVETYTSARAALDYMSRELSQAMVNSNSLEFFGVTNAVAFIAPLGNNYGGAVDLAEVVYRLTNANGVIPPYTLVRRSSVYTNPPPSDCLNYATTPPSACGTAAWDIYNNNVTWMETSDSNLTAALAENVISLTFTYVSATNYPYAYWNSTTTASVWNNEFPNLLSTLFNAADIRGDANSQGEVYMTNRAPAGVYINLVTIDSRAAARLSAVPYQSTAWYTIANSATQSFTTFVAIPNQ
ncbi:MAG TPA: prepilin-type N-terminal cleavage/methylation domain-containing protein [Verrucomicrobiae bacterium]|nr:prepilin-type N-terminal cleavage/methylation domain-containing protein [Verrucomicrobiae bacterium]